MPVLRSFYLRTHKPDSDYEIVAISLDAGRESAEEAAKEWKIPFPVLLDPTGQVAGEYRVEGIPTLVVIDRSGTVKYASTGFNMAMEFILAQQLEIKNYTPGRGANQ